MKKKLWKKTLCVITSAVMLAGVISSCGQEQQDNVSVNGSGVTLAGGDSVYPMQSEDTLTVWVAMNDSAKLKYTNLAETPFGKQWMEETGANIEFIHPTSGNAAEQFNLLLTSKNKPDIIIYDWYSVAGGPQKYIDEEVIYSLNDIIDNYSPNLKKYLEENPDIDKSVKTDTGKYYVYPFVRGNEKLTVSKGPIIRKSILTQLNMQVPETIDEWHELLLGAKNLGVSTPLSYKLLEFEKNGIFSGAFGVKEGFYLDDNGKVQYGPAQPGVKQYLETMKQWFDEGLLDQNISNVEQKVIDANILNNSTVATVGYAGSAIGTYINAGVDMIAAPNPVLEKGTISEFGQKDNAYVPSNSAAITTDCKNIELAARFLDYAYGDKGSLLLNFGVEGESYTMEDGNPAYTDVILNNQEGYSISQALSMYMMIGSGPYVQDVRYIDQFYQHKEQRDALDVWANTNSAKHLIPQITFNSEESRKVAKLTNEIQTYVEEMWLKFIMGVETLDNFDAYIAQLDALGLQELIEYEETALARYNER
ncbi:MAG: extracellular solute-binding protein [Clostridia bacterium]|nr:extracellular solute-binding protein [Clostridia bacterium]